MKSPASAGLFVFTSWTGRTDLWGRSGLCGFRRLLSNLLEDAVVNSRRFQFIAYAVISFIAFAFFLYLSKPIWVLPGALAGYFLYRAFSKGSSGAPPFRSTNVVVGELGNYHMDGPDEDALFGMYIDIDGIVVFVDIKRDRLLPDRLEYATYLSKSGLALRTSLDAFLDAHAEFRGRAVGTIGLHSHTDAEQGEVFWIPDGYTVLKGASFVSPP
jgi:hypothetical protein